MNPQKAFLTASAHELAQDHMFNGIDLVKFVCAFLICMIHIPLFPSSYSAAEPVQFYVQNCFTRIAVPFFFVTSGFLLFRKTDLYDLDTDRVKGYVLKTVRLLGIWTVLLFQGGHGHLWYLSALVVAVVLLSVLLKKHVKVWIIAAIALATYAIGLLGDSYYGFTAPLLNYTIPKLLIIGFDNVVPNARNGFTFGLVFVLMGALFAQKRIVVNKIVAAVGFVVSFVGLFAEVFLLRNHSEPKDYNMLICLLPTVFFLFYLASHVNLQNRPIYARLRAIGILIFFSHLFVDYFVGRAFVVLEKLRVDFSPVRFIVTVGLTVVLAVVIERLSRKDKLSWLKYLYA